MDMPVSQRQKPITRLPLPLDALDRGRDFVQRGHDGCEVDFLCLFLRRRLLCRIFLGRRLGLGTWLAAGERACLDHGQRG
jgi:hypothetical protein